MAHVLFDKGVILDKLFSTQPFSLGLFGGLFDWFFTIFFTSQQYFDDNCISFYYYYLLINLATYIT